MKTEPQSNPFSVQPFSFEGPHTAPPTEPLREAEMLEKRATNARTPEERERFERAAVVFRYIAELPADKADEAADDWFEEVELRLKALAALRGKSVMAFSDERAVAADLIQRLESDCIHGDDTTSERASILLHEIAENATRSLRHLADTVPDRIKTLTRRILFFPFMSNGRSTETKEAVKARKDFLEDRMEIGKDVPESEVLRRKKSDLWEQVVQICAWIRTESGKSEARRRYSKNHDVKSDPIDRIFESFDPETANVDEWLEVARAALRSTYEKNPASLPRISGVNWESGWQEAGRKQAEICDKWASSLPAHLIPPRMKTAANSEDDLAKRLDVQEIREYTQDAKRFDELSTTDWQTSFVWKEYLEKFSQAFREFFPLIRR